jgi:hypothetical protein
MITGQLARGIAVLTVGILLSVASLRQMTGLDLKLLDIDRAIPNENFEFCLYNIIMQGPETIFHLKTILKLFNL